MRESFGQTDKRKSFVSHQRKTSGPQGSSFDKTGKEFIQDAKDYKVVINELKALLRKGQSSHHSSQTSL